MVVLFEGRDAAGARCKRTTSVSANCPPHPTLPPAARQRGCYQPYRVRYVTAHLQSRGAVCAVGARRAQSSLHTLPRPVLTRRRCLVVTERSQWYFQRRARVQSALPTVLSDCLTLTPSHLRLAWRIGLSHLSQLSGTWRTSPRRERLFCSIDHGTTVLEWSASWASAHLKNTRLLWKIHQRSSEC